MKNIVVISNFFTESSNSRPNLSYKYFKENNYNVKVICSDFSHSKKEKEVYSENEDLIIIETKKYKKNISLKRIYSHILFAKQVVKELKKLKVDLVYLNIPPNILGYLVSKYCEKNNIKLILDVIDLWPESLPIPSKIKIILDLTVNILWKNLRRKTLERSHFIITESNYFYNFLNLKKFLNSKVIYLKKNQNLEFENQMTSIKKNNSILKIGYLGNLGKIYDFKSLVLICKELNKSIEVQIEIIGDGEEKNNLLESLKENHIKYNFYGIIFDEDKKYEIMNQ